MTTILGDQFDLTPDPRVLQMLGEINLDQWKCIAELVDNSVDAFIHSRRAGSSIAHAEVIVGIPTHDREDAVVSVRDNGPGMTIGQLETAVRAGWTGNNPIDSLGLFGMGFNIATARLGFVTEVFTTRRGDAEWTGLRIDLDELRRTRSYHTPRLTRPKPNTQAQGTEIRILRLKQEQRTYFSKSGNHQKIRKQLARVYSPLLLGKDSSFSLQLNGQVVQARRACHWDPSRTVQAPDGRTVAAVEEFNFELPERGYCLKCMIPFQGGTCPTQGPDCKVTTVKRRLRGWVGLQRFMHEEDFGLDLIRNGRVIEIQNKDLFIWSGGERPEREYPIDDQRNRGRFIGEVHLDHCRVSYTKDRFERDDQSWSEMVSLVRGDGPLQPQKAKGMGYGPQDAPLYRLFQAFRRSSPQGKAGRWTRILAVKNNERAIEMADLFHRGEPEYQTDEKWFALVEEEDNASVGGGSTVGGPQPEINLPPGMVDDPPSAGTGSPPPSVSEALPKMPVRRKSNQLSRIYKHPLVKVEFNVEAFESESSDPDLEGSAPWRLKLDDPATRTFVFLFVPSHSVFRSVTLTPSDALLCELALKTYEFLRDTSPSNAVFSSILSDLRKEYARETRLDAVDIISRANAVLKEVAGSVVNLGDAVLFPGIFAKLSPAAQETIRKRIALSGGATMAAAISSGEFLLYADPEAIRSFVVANPDYYFDGHFWDQPYRTLDYGSESVNEEARMRILQRYDGYLSDATWLAAQSSRDLERVERDELIRVVLSLSALRPDKSL